MATTSQEGSKKSPGRKRPEYLNTFSRVFNIDTSSAAAASGAGAAAATTTTTTTTTTPRRKERRNKSESKGVLGGPHAASPRDPGPTVDAREWDQARLGPATAFGGSSGYYGGGDGGGSRGRGRRGAGGGKGRDLSRGLGRRSGRSRRGVGLEWGEYFEGGGVRETEGMVLFWKEPACFVQWTPSTFEIEGIAYCNAEQWMMANKARLFNDSATLHEIMATADPREQKALGRRVKGFDAAVWDRHAFEVVVRGNLEKFRQNDSFLQQLLATGDKILAEASPYDTEWGIGLHASDDDALVQRRWRGKNKLGEALMDVRAQLRVEMYRRKFSNGGFPFLEGSSSDGFDADEYETIGEHRARRK